MIAGRFAAASPLPYDAPTQQRAKPKMPVDELLAWAVENPGRYELAEGEVYAMSPERICPLAGSPGRVFRRHAGAMDCDASAHGLPDKFLIYVLMPLLQNVTNFNGSHTLPRTPLAMTLLAIAAR